MCLPGSRRELACWPCTSTCLRQEECRCLPAHISVHVHALSALAASAHAGRARLGPKGGRGKEATPPLALTRTNGGCGAPLTACCKVVSFLLTHFPLAHATCMQLKRVRGVDISDQEVVEASKRYAELEGREAKRGRRGWWGWWWCCCLLLLPGSAAVCVHPAAASGCKGSHLHASNASKPFFSQAAWGERAHPLPPTPFFLLGTQACRRRPSCGLSIARGTCPSPPPPQQRTP